VKGRAHLVTFRINLRVGLNRHLRRFGFVRRSRVPRCPQMSCPKEHRILNCLILQGILLEDFSLVWTSEDICGLALHCSYRAGSASPGRRDGDNNWARRRVGLTPGL